ncbi:MAG: CoA pyrophosphatase [Desulfobacteraceae bacterium]|nr:CoA pyrophosphatase [Desulfobacteraceae bacterium]
MNKEKYFDHINRAIQKSSHPGPPEPGLFQLTSVIALFSYTDQLSLLFIQKADVPGYPWANQMAFPGGHQDKNDSSAMQTALRELEEETGISKADIDVIGSLGHFQTINNKDIEAFAGFWNQNGTIHYDSHEISRVFHIPFKYLVNIHKEKNYHTIAPNIMQLTYPFEDVLIWGVTAKMLFHLIQVVITDYPGIS